MADDLRRLGKRLHEELMELLCEDCGAHVTSLDPTLSAFKEDVFGPDSLLCAGCVWEEWTIQSEDQYTASRGY